MKNISIERATIGRRKAQLLSLPRHRDNQDSFLSADIWTAVTNIEPCLPTVPQRRDAYPPGGV
jgi:hypothetical protein